MPSLSVIVVRDYELVDVLNMHPLFYPLIIEETNKKGTDRSVPFNIIQLGISCIYKVFGLAEVSSKETFECLTVSCLVACHLMNCIMDCIEV